MMEGVLNWFQATFVDQFNWILILGLVAQSMFMMRFVVQWIASERIGRSIVPVAFWFFSVGGGLLLLTYGVLKQEPVIILGQSLGLLIYGRNLWFIFTEKKSPAHPPDKVS
jgi:lipid-A-disaccharide synthase-like uncharacterized protein